MKKLLVLALVALAPFASHAASITTTYQQGVSGYTGAVDTELSGDAPDTNFSNGGSLYPDREAVRYCGASCNNVLLRFGNLGIDPSATITNVTLQVKESGQQGTSDFLYASKVAHSDWDAVSATWNSYKTSTPWTTKGGDVSALVSTASAPGAGGWVTFALGTSFSLSELQQNGVLLSTDIPGWNYVWFYSNEATNPADRPILAVTYTTSGTTPPPADTTAPTTPSAFSATAASASQINLSWVASSDNVGVTGYDIYRNGTKFTTTTATSYADTGLAASTAYTYTIDAYDAAGNTSTKASASATTQAAPVPTFALGARVQSTASLNVRSKASTKGTLLCTQPLGALGTIIGGPTTASGYKWWKVNFDTGCDGWVVQTYLKVVTSTPPPPAPTATLTASPTSITSGQSSTLTWSSTNASSCTGTNFTASGTSGSVSVGPSSTTSYSVTCTGAGGSASASATVTVGAVTQAPTASLSANPTSVTSGQSSTLSWSSTNATSCSGTGFTASGTSGSQSVAPTTSTTYGLTCTGAGGSANASASVTVSTGTTTVPSSWLNGFKMDLSYVNQGSTAFSRLKTLVDNAIAGNPDYGFSADKPYIMYKVTGDPKYLDFAIQWVETCPNSFERKYYGERCGVQEEEATISAGGIPRVAGDSYLEVGDIIGPLAMVYDAALATGKLTASQKTRWEAYANQAIYNVWHPNQASWGGVSHPWSGWSIDNPGNNYYYSFVQATMFWALATRDSTLLSFTRNQKLQPLINYFAQLPGGGSLEGTGYGTAHMRMFYLYQIWKDSTGEDIANATSHLTDSIHLWAQQTTPNRAYYDPVGDLARESFPNLFDYHRRLVLEARRLTTSTAAQDLASWWLNHISVTQMARAVDSQWDLLPAGSNTAAAPTEPLVYQATGIGRIFARTGWDTNALWVTFVAGKYNESHAHQDQGSFDLANNGWLAVTNNIYSSSGIEQTSDYNNMLRFVQNGTMIPQAYNTQAVLTVNSSSPSTGDVNVTGNITPSYAGAGGITWSRNLVLSSAARMLTVTDTYSANAGVQAIFQLNTPAQPVVSGNTITAGQLRVKVVTPSNPTITVVSLAGHYRIDISGGAGSYVVQLSDQTIALNTSTFNRYLAQGSVGADVKALQKLLNAKSFMVATTGDGSTGQETTYFGPATKDALSRFQAANGLAAVGQVGPKTLELLLNMLK